MKKLLFIIMIHLLLISCRHGAALIKPPMNAPSDDATIKLAEAASSISDSMLEVAKIEKVIYPSSKDNTLSNAVNLQARASVDWSGPIKEITERTAQAGNFRLRILGKEPAIPVLISLNIKDQSLAEILRNIDYQAGSKASIQVYPQNQVVELRYAQPYS